MMIPFFTFTLLSCSYCYLYHNHSPSSKNLENSSVPTLPCEIASLSSPLSQRASSNKHLPNKRTKTPLIAICAFHSSSSPHTSASPSSPC